MKIDLIGAHDDGIGAAVLLTAEGPAGSQVLLTLVQESSIAEQGCYHCHLCRSLVTGRLEGPSFAMNP